MLAVAVKEKTYYNENANDAMVVEKTNALCDAKVLRDDHWHLADLKACQMWTIILDGNRVVG
jgi:hypothetical protein